MKPLQRVFAVKAGASLSICGDISEISRSHDFIWRVDRREDASGLICIKPSPFCASIAAAADRPELTMRAVLVLGLSIMLLASAEAAAVHRAKSPAANLRARAPGIAHPDAGGGAPARFSVPGWSDEQTRQWIDNATSCEGCG
jgi:hypothetical protein